MNRTTIIILLVIAAILVPGGVLLLFTFLRNTKEIKKGVIDPVWVWENYLVGSENNNPDAENHYEQLFFVDDLIKIKKTNRVDFYANNFELNPKITYIPYGTVVKIPKQYKA